MQHLSTGTGKETSMGTSFAEAKSFLKKFTNDWALNLAGMLAYNLMMTIFPIVLAIVSITGLLLGSFGMQDTVVKNLSAALPSNISKDIDLAAIVKNLHQASGLLGLISFLGLVWAGSNLFSIMEACFDIVFRAEQRTFLWQKLMSICMVVVFAVLAPLIAIASSLTAAASGIAKLVPFPIPGLPFLLGLLGPLFSILAAFVLFLAIYTVVPNMKISFRHAWRGALVSAVLMTAITTLYPFYVSHFLKTGQYGATAGFAIIILTWFWFFSVILMLGAEVNSFWALGQRPADADIPLMMHTVQVHGTAPNEGEDAEAPPEGHPKEPEAAAKAKAERVTTHGDATKHVDTSTTRARNAGTTPSSGSAHRGTRSLAPETTAHTGKGMVVLTSLALALSLAAGRAATALQRRGLSVRVR